MKKFYIDYISNEDDLCHVWLNAYNKEDAKERVKREYWDIKEIIRVYNERN